MCNVDVRQSPICKIKKNRYYWITDTARFACVKFMKFIYPLTFLLYDLIYRFLSEINHLFPKASYTIKIMRSEILTLFKLTRLKSITWIFSFQVTRSSFAFDLTFYEIATFCCETIKTRGKNRNYPCRFALFIAYKMSASVSFFFSFSINSAFSFFLFLLRYKCVKEQLSMVRTY